MSTPEHPMLPYLIDLETPYSTERDRPYDVADLIRFALTGTDYWADLAVGWVEQGAPASAVVDELSALAASRQRPQSLRHRSTRQLKQQRAD